jgi:hypothetical protein
MNGNCNLNVGGCVDVVSNMVSQEKQANGAGSCGDLINADFGCESYACNNCSSDSDYNACITSADMNECSQYHTPFASTTGACAFLNDASALVNACFANNDTDFQTMVTVMCGSNGPSDAGGD